MNTYWETNNKRQEHIIETILKVIIPSTVMMLFYILIGNSYQGIPSLMLFFICAAVSLFPAELFMVFRDLKKNYNSYSLRPIFEKQEKSSIWQTVLIAVLLFGFAGLVSAFIAPLEEKLISGWSTQLALVTPDFFDWTNLEYLKTYSKPILITTCIGYFIFNVFIGPITEELFFRGYLTKEVEKMGIWAPVFITVLFSLYHLWLPFANIFRIIIFLPAALLAWKKNDIRISILFHCACNLLSTISFAIAVLG